MNRNTPILAALLALLTLVSVVALVAPAAVAAQTAPIDPARWSQPVVAETVLRAPGQGTVEGDTLRLPAGKRVGVEAQARDQNGRPFPQERFRFGFDLDGSCNGLVQLESFDHGTINLRTADRSGTCEVLFWVPNNMNLDRRLRLEVGRTSRPAPDVAAPAPAPGGELVVGNRYELTAASIYQAVLGRNPDARWLADAATEARRGHSQDLIRNLLGTDEFRSRRQRLSPEQLLESFYRGMLGRDLDPSGRQTYAGDMRAGRYEDVLLDLLRSDELRQRLAREAG